MIGIHGGARLSNVVKIRGGDGHGQVRPQEPQRREHAFRGVKELEEHAVIDAPGQTGQRRVPCGKDLDA
jgi:hypothetical protein